MIIQTQIKDSDIALKRFSDYLNSIGKKLFSVVDLNNFNHKLVICTDSTRYYCIFKKLPLLSWKAQFPELKYIGNIDYVDSINVPYFYNAKDKYHCKNIYIVYSNGSIYKKSTQEWLEIANQYELYRKVKRLTTVKDEGGSEKYISETTISCYFTEQDRVI